jgi:hypothetical protein
MEEDLAVDDATRAAWPLLTFGLVSRLAVPPVVGRSSIAAPAGSSGGQSQALGRLEPTERLQDARAAVREDKRVTEEV